MAWKFSWLIVTCAGLGNLPKGSGTLASAVAAVFWGYILYSFYDLPWAYFILIGGWCVVGVICIASFEKISHSHDSSKIVVDEWIGMALSLLFNPLTPAWILAAFIGFRFFDIFKPLGIGKIDRSWSSAWGVMADDLLAGLYTSGLLWVVRVFFFA